MATMAVSRIVGGVEGESPEHRETAAIESPAPVA
jgi:hypothetical protein